MGANKKLPLDYIKKLKQTHKSHTKEKDLETIKYLYYDRMMSLQEIQTHFKTKYTYNEIKDIVRGTYIDYYEKEKKLGIWTTKI